MAAESTAVVVAAETRATDIAQTHKQRIKEESALMHEEDLAMFIERKRAELAAQLAIQYKQEQLEYVQRKLKEEEDLMNRFSTQVDFLMINVANPQRDKEAQQKPFGIPRRKAIEFEKLLNDSEPNTFGAHYIGDALFDLGRGVWTGHMSLSVGDAEFDRLKELWDSIKHTW